LKYTRKQFAQIIGTNKKLVKYEGKYVELADFGRIAKRKRDDIILGVFGTKTGITGINIENYPN
jgi:hypothetical protein